jgi:hypothetical protein
LCQTSPISTPRKPESPACSAKPPPTAEQAKPLNILWALLVSSLIGTMLPFKILVTFFSLSTVITALIALVMILKKQIKFSKPASAVLVALLVVLFPW